MLILLSLSGCAGLGPSVLKRSRIRYNETIKTSSEEEMLLNIVRLRYSDTPSSLAVSSIAAQFELAGNFGISPFFAAGAEQPFSVVLPQAGIAGADRPTFSLTPIDDSDFARRLFTPLSLEGVIYLAKTTWPIQTVFRLYLENMNWVPNAQTASGPTPPLSPPKSAFSQGMDALQKLQESGDLVFGSDEVPIGIGPPVAQLTASEMLTAAQQGLSISPSSDGKGWVLNRLERRFLMRVNPTVVGSPEMRALQRIFHLREGLSEFEVTLEKLNPFGNTASGLAQIDLETRSLIQALYFVSHGVDVPAEHLARGIAVQTRKPDGSPFDWNAVTLDLFRVRSASGACDLRSVQVAVEYSGYCFFIAANDLETKRTFGLLMELARLQFPAQNGKVPVLTIPIGGR
jgi:hypothetical protein